MNILIVSQHFFPEEFRINELSVELFKRGNYVEVITGMPNYPQGEIFPGYENKFDENYNGVIIHRTPIRPRHQGSINLFLNYLSFMRNGKKTLKRINRKPDIIISYQTSPVMQIIPAIKAKKIYKVPLITYCMDQWPASLKARGIKSGMIYKLFGIISKMIYKKCDYIINASPSFVEYNEKINKYPIDKMDWTIQYSEDIYYSSVTIKNKNTVDLLFAGNIGKVQNVEDIIRAYAELRYPNLFIHIIGDGSSIEKCKTLISELDVSKNVIIYGRVPTDKMIDYYVKADACLLTLSGKCEIGNTIPSKLTGYLCAGKTILAAISGDSRKIIEDAKAGIYTDPDDYLKLAKLISEYYNNLEKYSVCGNNGRKYFEENCTIDSYINKLLLKIKELIRNEI